MKSSIIKKAIGVIVALLVLGSMVALANDTPNTGFYAGDSNSGVVTVFNA